MLLSCPSKEPPKKSIESLAAQNSSPPAIVAKTPWLTGSSETGKDASLPDVAERAVRSVVNVFSLHRPTVQRQMGPRFHDPFFDYFVPEAPRPERARSLGSGVIISSEGIILTNNHVVANAQQIRVKLFDGRELEATPLGSDAKSDLAVLKLKDKVDQLTPLPLGDSSKLRLGEPVLAIGNPFGVGQTVTLGIVSALGRANVGILDYEDFIQTDAAINPGNSGGALVNMRAELVGINTAIFSKSGGYQGIGFAIPTEMAKPIMTSLLKHGRVIRGWLGVMIQDFNEDVARALNLPKNKGILVTDIAPDGPAAKAGLRREDVIIALNDRPIESVAHFRNHVAVAGAHSQIRLNVLRKGKPVQLTIELSELSEEATATLDRSQGALGGLTLEPLTEENRRQLNLPQRISGVLVQSVEAGSAAESAGLREKDVIVEINRQGVRNPMEFANQYKQSSGNVVLLVYRQGTVFYLLLEK